MAITFDPAKRDWTMANRGLNFEDAPIVFGGPRYDQVDARRDYGETRVITVGFLAGRMVIVGWTPRGDNQHIFSMRKANAREQRRYEKLLA
ncbi:BrnT family toxin [Enterovirga aerilata]|uniref:BrnT family toxin n=1 Tax=Enterovirga aerilata TaxID=2730920 RepID=A0A849I4Z2_9HYPH|nr:BrnT family toxin [Enterovirga sp. DB1703]NNM74512.1 BrnT family toxin [Enterovirga sp. DB1703]